MKNITTLCMAMLTSFAVQAQSYTETFDSNSLDWNECAYESDEGYSIIDKGVLTVKSNGEKKAASIIFSAIAGANIKLGQNTFFETHCYAPLDVHKPFEITSDVKIKELSYDKLCGLIFNYRDDGNFYCFAFNDEHINFIRYANHKIVGIIPQGVKWKDTERMKQHWKLTSDGDILSFFVNDQIILQVKYMPLEYSGVGFYTYGKQRLTVSEITFTQL